MYWLILSEIGILELHPHIKLMAGCSILGGFMQKPRWLTQPPQPMDDRCGPQRVMMDKQQPRTVLTDCIQKLFMVIIGWATEDRKSRGRQHGTWKSTVGVQQCTNSLVYWDCEWKQCINSKFNNHNSFNSFQDLLIFCGPFSLIITRSWILKGISSSAMAEAAAIWRAMRPWPVRYEKR